MADIDIDHLREWIGREEVASETLTCAITDRFNATFDRKGNARDTAKAPILIHICLALPMTPTADLAADGHPARGGFLPPVPLPNRMWAGGAFDFLGDIRVGETVTRRSIIREVTVKQGRSGRLCFVTVEHHITSDGQPVLKERQDIVYRGANNAFGAKSVATSAPKGSYTASLKPSQALLFRYSALTFNSHRIHFDTPYVRGVERYPGLVVHGPMQATMLAHLAEEIHGSSPKHFEFRSLSPLFDDADFILNAEQDGAALKLWTSNATGTLAMQARASW